MLYQLAIALGSGIASAVLFLLPAKGSLAALLLGVLAPLPILIAAIGFGPRSAGIASLAGLLLIGLVLHPYLAGAFLVSTVFPAVFLGWLTMRRFDQGGEWPSPQVLLLAIVALAVGLDLAGIGLLALRYDSYDAAVADLARRFSPLILSLFGPDGVPGGFNVDVFARMMVVAMAPLAAAWGVLALAVNLWLSARVAQVSGRLRRPWTDLPSTLSLPRAALFVFVAAVAGSVLLSGLAMIACATLAAALGVAFALHGLCAVHALTRGNSARPGLLAALYAINLALFPWPLIIAAGLGIADLFHPLRRLPAPPKKPPTIHQN